MPCVDGFVKLALEMVLWIAIHNPNPLTRLVHVQQMPKNKNLYNEVGLMAELDVRRLPSIEGT